MCIRDRAVANVGNSGIGMFYWEPAWLPANYAYNEDGTLNTELYKANQNAWLENGCGSVSYTHLLLHRLLSCHVKDQNP